MASPSAVRPITTSDFSSILDLLERAFDDDPWFNFVVANDAQRRMRLRRWIRRGLERKTYPWGETYMAGTRGAALWVPPHARSRPLLDEIELRATLLRVSGPGRLRTVREGIRRVVAAVPAERHMELRTIGVAPEFQQQGVASSLLRPMLGRCDAERLAIGLLCTKAQSVPLYRHFGFEVTREVQVPGGPVLWQMWRTARSD